MSIYKRFCHETTDREGNLEDLTLCYPENFNFGYDVVDAIAAKTPEKRALVWCNVEGEEHIFTFADIKRPDGQRLFTGGHRPGGPGDAHSQAAL